MTVATTDITAGPYAGNGVADTFAYDWTIQSASELTVYETDDSGTTTTLTEGSDYTVSGVGNEGGGSVTRTAGPLPSGYTWLIRSNFQSTQNIDFASQGAFYPQVHEAAFDKLTYLVQQLEDETGRSLKFSASSTYKNIDLPDPEAGKTIQWNSTGDGLINVDSPGAAAASAQASADAAATSEANAADSAASAADSAASAANSADDAAAYAAALNPDSKMDKLASSTAGNILTLDGSGNASGELDPTTLQDHLFDATASLTAAYTVATTDNRKLFLANGTFTITLPAAATAGDGFAIGVRNTGTGTITVDGNAAEQIDGAATLGIAANSAAILVCDGSAWHSVGSSAGSSQQIRTRTLLGSGTYTPAADVSEFYVFVTGATGGISSTYSYPGGPGGPGYAEKKYTQPFGSYSYAVGAGGAPGTDGGTTTFDTITVTGSGGVTTTAGGAGGVASGGDFNANGGNGGNNTGGATNKPGGPGGAGSRAGDGGVGGISWGNAGGGGGTGGNNASHDVGGAAATARLANAITLPSALNVRYEVYSAGADANGSIAGAGASSETLLDVVAPVDSIYGNRAAAVSKGDSGSDGVIFIIEVLG